MGIFSGLWLHQLRAVYVLFVGKVQSGLSVEDFGWAVWVIWTLIWFFV